MPKSSDALDQDVLWERLMVEVQESNDRRQRAVRFHTLLHQRSSLGIPGQYERLFLHSLGKQAEKKHDARRGTKHSNSRRGPQTRV